MAKGSEIGSRTLEVGRVREQTLTDSALEIHAAAGYMVEALRTGKGLHLLGEGAQAHLAAYLAEALHRPADDRTLPARVLPGADADGPARAVEAFVRFGEVVVVLTEHSTPRVERAAALARGCKARVVCLCGAGAAENLRQLCDVVVPIHAISTVLAEVSLSIGLLLRDLVLAGLQGPGTRRVDAQTLSSSSSSSSSAHLAVRTISDSTQSASDVAFIDRDSGGSDLSYESADGELLADAVEHNLAPPTNPHGRPLRREQPKSRNLRFRCGACMEIINAESRFAGRKGQCPHCYCEFRIPEVEEGSDETTTIPPEAIIARPPTHPGAPIKRGPTRRRTRRTERRRSSRFNVRDAIVRFRCDAYPDGSAYLEPHTLDNLSLTGLRFVGRADQFKIGDVFYFSVDFPAFPEAVRFKGEIRRVLLLKEGEGCSAGVRFLEYVGDAETRIRRLLDHENLRSVRRR